MVYTSLIELKVIECAELVSGFEWSGEEMYIHTQEPG